MAIVGGHGQGKSVLLQQIAEHFADQEGFRVVLVSHPAGPTALDCLEALVGALGCEHDGSTPQDRLTDWLEQVEESLVLIFDELDKYGDSGPAFFNALESLRQDQRGRIGILVAGGLGVLRLASQDVGSTLLARARLELLVPYSSNELAKLLEHYTDRRGGPLPPEAVMTLELLSGGNPALVAYALERLWEKTPGDVSAIHIDEVFSIFRAENVPFLDACDDALGLNSEGHQGPLLALWRRIEDLRPDETVGRAELLELLPPSQRSAARELDTLLELLCAAGLIRLVGGPRVRRAPELRIEPIPSILAQPDRLSEPEPAAGGVAWPQRVGSDLNAALSALHAFGLSFWRDATHLVAEEVLSACIAAHFRARGWDVSLEERQVQGRVDLKLRHVAFPGQHALVEVKKWSNGDKGDVHEQVLGYGTEGTAVYAVAMIGDTSQCEGWSQAEWRTHYAEACLGGCDDPVEVAFSPPLALGLRAQRSDGPHQGVAVDHYVVVLPRRRHPH